MNFKRSGDRNISGFIFICVSKMNETIMGLEMHDWNKWFLDELTLKIQLRVNIFNKNIHGDVYREKDPWKQAFPHRFHLPGLKSTSIHDIAMMTH